MFISKTYRGSSFSRFWLCGFTDYLPLRLLSLKDKSKWRQVLLIVIKLWVCSVYYHWIFNPNKLIIRLYICDKKISRSYHSLISPWMKFHLRNENRRMTRVVNSNSLPQSVTKPLPNTFNYRIIDNAHVWESAELITVINSSLGPINGSTYTQ